MQEFSRRSLLGWGLGWGALVSEVWGRRVFAAACATTPAQTEGPYYPQSDLNRDNDLTQITPTSPKALGTEIVITGQVLDPDCKPIERANVEIWQAAASGKYNHSEDVNPLPLDPYFQYWGRTISGVNGEYIFRTILPGHYPLENGSYRPPHIHFKAHAPRFFSLTTQMYFDPESFTDPVLKAKIKELNDLEHVDRRLMVRFALRRDVLTGRFDITLRKN